MNKERVSIGIDLGGTKIGLGIVNEKGKVLKTVFIPTKKASFEDIAQDIIEHIKLLIDEYTDQLQIASIGIGIAGQVDNQTGVVYFAPNLNWHDAPLKQTLEEALHIPVKVTNDVRAAAWGEWLYGSAIGCHDMVLVFIGTGIGAGIVVHNKMQEGASNTFGEIGHMTIDINGATCTCGNQGCWETLAGGWAIAKNAQAAVQADPMRGKKILEAAHGQIDAVTARTVIEMAHAQDPFAQELLKVVTKAICVGVLNLVHAFNPQKVVLGGGIVKGMMPGLLEDVRVYLDRFALKTPAQAVEIVEATFLEDAGIIGAAAFALSPSKCFAC